MTAQKKFYIVASIFLVLVAAWVMFYYLPILEDISDNKIKSGSYNTKITSASKAQVNIEEAQKSFKLVEDEIAGLEKKLVDKKQLEKIANILKSHATKYNVSVINISPIVTYYFKITESDEKNSGVLTRLPFEMNLSATFLNFGKFLSDIQHLPFYIHPEGVKIEVSKNSLTLLDINFKASIYVKSEEMNGNQ